MRTRARAAAEPYPDADDPGDSSGEATPVPIPNTEVKLSSAEDTERAAFRENRSSPGFLRFRGSTRAASVTGPRDAGLSLRMTAWLRPSRAHRPAPIAPRRLRPSIAPSVRTCCRPTAPGAASTPTREHRCTAVAPARSSRPTSSAVCASSPTTRRARPIARRAWPSAEPGRRNVVRRARAPRVATHAPGRHRSSWTTAG